MARNTRDHGLIRFTPDMIFERWNPQLMTEEQRKATAKELRRIANRISRGVFLFGEQERYYPPKAAGVKSEGSVPNGR